MMVQMPRPYPFSSMTALVCFEAAARLAGFKAAAGELNVTPAAISHQIKLLEVELGCILFRRLHRGVELTETGALLFVALRRGFEGISEVVQQLHAQPSHRAVTVRATTAVSALWLTPKITTFWRNHANVSISQSVSDVPETNFKYDIHVGYGLGGAPHGTYYELYQDNIIALGTAHFAQKYNITCAGDLVRAPLVEMHYEYNKWTDWAEWLQELGFQKPTGRAYIVNNHMIALQAAEDDIGAVLGWEGMMSDQLTKGRLKILTPDAVASPKPFMLHVHSRASESALIFADWLRQNARKAPDR